MKEEDILHFIRSMNATESDSEPRGERYQVRGIGEIYTVFDNYLLQEVDEIEHSNSIDHYVHLAADLNTTEHAIQHDYDKRLRDMGKMVSKE